ncbi:hypothetical protein F5I97DRAFT_281281 [Phlebopus sp. FC_14]|nr:hypothetical protein F5I97DRAFT_281281 [Phlebopus sp. FC_14]
MAARTPTKTTRLLQGRVRDHAVHQSGAGKERIKGDAASLTPSPTPSTTMTSQIPTTVVSTNAAGSTVIFTSTVATAIPGPVINPTPPSNHSSTNTAAIVGGVVGGIAGLALLALLIFCLRRRSRRDEFDGNFDPDRVGQAGGGTLPQVDLTDEVAPFPHPQNEQTASMRQYAEPPWNAASGPPPGRAVSPDNAYMRSIPPGAGQPQVPLNLYGAAPADWHQPQPMTSPAPSTVSRTATTSRSAKEREAAGRGQGLGLATQQEAPEGSGGVVVHQDAGRAPSDEQVGPREVPPAYESIQP